VVELELLQRSERPIAPLGQLQRTPFESPRLVEQIAARIGLAEKRQGDVERAGSGQQPADRDRESGQARANARNSR
jgi:hypothetical protein